MAVGVDANPFNALASVIALSSGFAFSFPGVTETPLATAPLTTAAAAVADPFAAAAAPVTFAGKTPSPSAAFVSPACAESSACCTALCIAPTATGAVFPATVVAALAAVAPEPLPDAALRTVAAVDFAMVPLPATPADEAAPLLPLPALRIAAASVACNTPAEATEMVCAPLTLIEPAAPAVPTVPTVPGIADASAAFFFGSIPLPGFVPVLELSAASVPAAALASLLPDPWTATVSCAADVPPTAAFATKVESATEPALPGHTAVAPAGFGAGVLGVGVWGAGVLGAATTCACVVAAEVPVAAAVPVPEPPPASGVPAFCVVEEEFRITAEQAVPVDVPAAWDELPEPFAASAEAITGANWLAVEASAPTTVEEPRTPVPSDADEIPGDGSTVGISMNIRAVEGPKSGGSTPIFVGESSQPERF